MKDFNVFITNLKQYTYGNFCGEWVTLPTTRAHMKEVFDRNEITEDSGYFFTDYDLPINEMQRDFGEFQRIDELNYLAAGIEYLDDDSFNKLSEIVKSAVDTFDGPADYINLLRHLDCFELIPASNEYDLGTYLVETSIGVSALEQNIPGVTRLGDYFDYEKIGYDASVNMNGMFGENCFVIKNSSYENTYEGEIPYDYVVQPENPHKFDYQFLGRLKSDCNYFLGYGNAKENVLWAGSVEEQISKMQEIYDKLPVGEKPEWLTQDDINRYSKDMIAARNGLLLENYNEM